MRIRTFGAFLGTLVAAGPGLAAEPPAYRDDRSDPAALVRSLYNAVNRREYARAWDYFGDTKPAPDFDSFAVGFADTDRVEVETGAVSEEGAAGSVHYQVPVAIRATATDGTEKIFAGCYPARLANPQIQGVPFRPLSLGKGSLKPAAGELVDAVPPACGDGPPPAPRDAMLERAKAMFSANYGNECETLGPDAEARASEPETHEIKYRYASDGDDGDERTARLFRFGCNLYAYNTDEVYYVSDDLGELRQLQFAQPELDIRYETADSSEKVEHVGIIGYTVTDRAVNSFYDPATLSITTFAKWRGVADASSNALYIFRDGRFSLIKYEVDASYDEEINPVTVLDYDTAP